MKIKTIQSQKNNAGPEFNTTTVVTRKGTYVVSFWQKRDNLLKVFKQGASSEESTVIAEFRPCWMPRTRFSDFEYEIGRLVMKHESDELLKLRQIENKKYQSST